MGHKRSDVNIFYKESIDTYRSNRKIALFGLTNLITLFLIIPVLFIEWITVKLYMLVMVTKRYGLFEVCGKNKCDVIASLTSNGEGDAMDHILYPYWGIIKFCIISSVALSLLMFILNSYFLVKKLKLIKVSLFMFFTNGKIYLHNLIVALILCAFISLLIIGSNVVSFISITFNAPLYLLLASLIINLLLGGVVVGLEFKFINKD